MRTEAVMKMTRKRMFDTMKRNLLTITEHPIRPRCVDKRRFEAPGSLPNGIRVCHETFSKKRIVFAKDVKD